jgi:hypothetical protein
MSRLNSFDVAGRVDNTSMLVGTEVYKKVATVKNYKINAVRRFMLEGLSPETGGLLKYHEISYEGDQYSTPAEFVNSLNPDVEVLRYHVLVVAINEDKHLFTRQGVTIGGNSEAVEEEDFIALSGITATTIRNLVSDLELRLSETIAELAAEVDTKLDTETTSINSSVALLTEAFSNEVSARSSLGIALNAKIDTETSNRNASIDSVYTALVNETEARAELETELIASIENETTLREAAITSVQTALVTEAESRAELATELSASISDETTAREAAITSVQTAITNESTSRAQLATSLNAAIATEATNRQAAVNTLNTAIANESTARATLGTTLTAAINTEATNRGAAITTLNTAITDEASTRASAITTLGTTVTNNYNTLSGSITTEANTRTNALQTVNNTINTLTSTVNGQTASITTAQNTIAGIDGKLNASYGLSVDANGRIASMKLLSNGTTSQIAFTADSFKVYNGTTAVSPFTVENGQVKMTGVTTADTLITPGSGPAYPSATWNGLSINNGNDNALRFRHANGQIGIEIGIIAGQLVLNWYNDQGVLIWRGGDSGIRYVNNVPASFTSYSIGLISSSVSQYPSQSEQIELEYTADQQLAISSGTGEQQLGITGPDSNATFPLNHQLKYNYSAGVNPESSANEIYEGFHNDQSASSPFITNGWWAYYINGPANSVFMEDGNGVRYLSLVYFNNGKPTNYIQIPNTRLSSGQN